METNYIPEFIALAEYGSSYVAAEKLFISQSSLLRHIQSIEDEFGMPLFDRNRKGFVLNQAGEIFLPYARQIASLKNRCYGALHREETESDVVRLYAEGKIIDLMIDFRKIHPEYRLDYVWAEDPAEALYEGTLDIAFLTNVRPEHADSFQAIPFMKEEVLALLYDDHPLAALESVSLEEMRQEDLVALTDEIILIDRYYDRDSLQSTRLNVVASVPTGMDLLRMVREKCGIALIHGVRSTTPPAKGLKVLPLNPPIEYAVGIYFRNDMPLSKAAETFVNYAKRWITLHRDTNQSLIE